MAVRVVKALVPGAIAAATLADEFATADLITDGTLVTVVIYGVNYSDVIERIRQWMMRSQVQPILVTDGVTAEELLASADHGHRHDHERARGR